MINAVLATILWAQAGTAPEASPSLAPSPTEPTPLPIELRWDAPAGCPDAAAVRAGIAHGLPPAPAGFAPMQVDVAVRPLGERWQAALALRGTDWTATRTLNGATCAAVADAAGLVIGLALTSELAAHEVVVAPAPPPHPPADAPLSTPLVGLAFASDVGTLPSATSGGALSLGWRRARARFELAGSLFASRAGVVTGRPDTGGLLSLASLAARGCWLWGRAASLGPCVGAGVDRVHGAGTGPITTVQATSVAPFGAVGLRGEWRLSRRVVPFLTVEAAIPLVRARFSVENVGLVHEAAAVSFRGAAGLELRFR
jgi:hypothetical protein